MKFPNFLDGLSRDHPSNLEIEIIQILILIQIGFLISIGTMYLLVKFRIFHSIQGPAKEARLTTFRSLLRSFYIVFLGMIIIISNNLITQFTPIFSSDKYYFVLTDSIFFNMGVVFLLYGFLSIFDDLDESTNNNLKPYQRELLFTIFCSLSLQGLFGIPVFGIFASISIIFLFYKLLRDILVAKRHFASYEPTVFTVRLRIYNGLMIFSSILIPVFFLIESLIQIDDLDIEVTIFLTSLYLLIIAFTLYLMVIAPKWIRERFKLSDQLFYKSRDPRMDYSWVPVDRTIHNYEYINDLGSTSYETTILTEPSLFSKNFIQLFFHIFQTDEITQIDNITSSVFTKFSNFRNNFVFVLSELNNVAQSIIDNYNERFNYQINLDKELSIDKFHFNDPNFHYGVISAIKSPFNIEKTWWLFLAHEQILTSLAEFVITYREYLMSLKDERQVLCVVKFKIENGKTQPIPANSDNPTQPNLDYLTFL